MFECSSVWTQDGEFDLIYKHMRNDMKGMRIHVYTTPEKLHRASKDMQWKYDGRGDHDSNQNPKNPA